MKFKTLIKDSLLAFGVPFKIGAILIANLIVIIIALQFSLYSMENYNQVDTILEQQYYNIFDNFEGDDIDTQSPDFLIKIKTLYNKMYNSKEFTYLDISKQKVLIEQSFDSQSHLFADYEKGSSVSNIKDSQTGIIYNMFNSIQIDKRALEHYDLDEDLQITNRWKGDLSSDKPIPVILGYDFQSMEISEGSVYKIKCLNIPFEIEILGFLPKDSHYYADNEMINLDRKVILPALEYSSGATNEEEWNCQKRVYVEKLNGIIVANNNRSVIQSVVSGICSETMLPTLSIQGALSGESVFKMQASEFAKMLMLLCVILSLFASVGLILSLIQDVTKNYAKFAVHLLCGAVVRDIYMICFIRYLFICIASAICSLFIANQILPLEKSVIYIGLGSVLIFCAIFMIFPLSKIRKNNIGALLRRNDE